MDLSKILDYIDPLVFLIALFVGILYTYVTTPPPRVVIKYPTPFNIKDTVYIDDNDICYKYNIKEVSCPADKSQIKYIIPTVQQSSASTH